MCFNTTHDAEERRWKVLQNHDMLAAENYVENVYYHGLARALRWFGYTVMNSARGDFEIAEVSAGRRERFSNVTRRRSTRRAQRCSKNILSSTVRMHTQFASTGGAGTGESLMSRGVQNALRHAGRVTQAAALQRQLR